jgi:hypothetical protein
VPRRMSIPPHWTSDSSGEQFDPRLIDSRRGRRSASGSCANGCAAAHLVRMTTSTTNRTFGLLTQWGLRANLTALS